ncbi:MAG: nucleoside phosphorylase [Sulfurospirillaceae bacterium]|nr:nucleoside phosphorylase [Sulfurospirillaceae bacterium]
MLAILGMGAKNTLKLDEVLQDHDIKRAINIGIAGCKNRSIEIGSLFCTTHELGFIKKESLGCHDKAINDMDFIETTLVDMESDIFLKITQKYLNKQDIYILKVVSDHLDTKIPEKEFVWKIMKKNLNEIVRVVTLKD